MTTTQHPLTDEQAFALAHEHPLIPDFARAAFDAGREHERAQAHPAEVTDEMVEAARRHIESTRFPHLRDTIVAALAVATPADPHHDPRPWQDCTRADIREGDLVERPCLGVVRVGVAHHQDEDGDWRARNGWVLTCGDRWPLRRIPARTTEKGTPLTVNTTTAEPLARTLLAVPEGYGAPHHDPGQIKADDYVMQVDESGFTRAGIAHRQDEDGDWRSKDGRLITNVARRADRPDALTVWPAPTPPAEEVKMPTTDGAVIIPAEGREFIEQVGDCANYRRLTYDAASGRWIGWETLNHEAEALSPEYITPGTWQEDRA